MEAVLKGIEVPLPDGILLHGPHGRRSAVNSAPAGGKLPGSRHRCAANSCFQPAPNRPVPVDPVRAETYVQSPIRPMRAPCSSATTSSRRILRSIPSATTSPASTTPPPRTVRSSPTAGRASPASTPNTTSATHENRPANPNSRLSSHTHSTTSTGMKAPACQPTAGMPNTHCPWPRASSNALLPTNMHRRRTRPIRRNSSIAGIDFGDYPSIYPDLDPPFDPIVNTRRQRAAEICADSHIRHQPSCSPLHELMNAADAEPEHDDPTEKNEEVGNRRRLLRILLRGLLSSRPAR